METHTLHTQITIHEYDITNYESSNHTHNLHLNSKTNTSEAYFGVTVFKTLKGETSLKINSRSDLKECYRFQCIPSLDTGSNQFKTSNVIW
jgi:hypothetical protein